MFELLDLNKDGQLTYAEIKEAFKQIFPDNYITEEKMKFILDRIDICAEAPTLNFSQITSRGKNESSKDIRERGMRCQQIQQERYKDYSFKFNSQIPNSLINKFCNLGHEEAEFMEEMYEKYALTARTYHKVLRVARTIADMDGDDDIRIAHLRESLVYRGLDKKFWEVTI